MQARDVAAGSRTLVLASASASRAALLQAAGVPFVVDPAHIDEAALKRSCAAAPGSAEMAAKRLAESKALAVCGRWPGQLVIGADQLLVCDGRWFDKAPTGEEARRTLLALRGRTHRLYTAVAVALDGSVVWRHMAVPELTMRAFSDDFLARYLEAGGETLLTSVGSYRLEGEGIQLFSEIRGDYFCVLGLPLLPLIGFLQRTGYLTE